MTPAASVHSASWLADRMELIPYSGIRRIFDLAASLRDPIDLSMGQPHFDVPQPVKDAAVAAIQAGHNGYTITQGIPDLRERIDRELESEFGWSPPILVTSGVSGGLVLALMAILNPGDEVIVPDPCFVSYVPLIGLCGGRAVSINVYDSFRLNPDDVEANITPHTKAILVNSPSNPTGVVYADEDIEALSMLGEFLNSSLFLYLSLTVSFF